MSAQLDSQPTSNMTQTEFDMDDDSGSPVPRLLTRDAVLRRFKKDPSTSGIVVTHIGGSLPPIFPRKPQEGSCRILKIILREAVKGERGGLDCTLIQADVIDECTHKVLFRGQMRESATMQDFFKKNSDLAKLPCLLFTYDGSHESKDKNRTPTKLFRIEALDGFVVKTA